jgi:chorismate dehydratase
MTPVRLGAVSYLNARPLVCGLDRSPRFSLRYDVPSICTRLLHAGEIDLGLVSSIEYTRGDAYRIVPEVAIASDGPVASIAIFATRPMADVRSIAVDTSSRTSVALVRVLCRLRFGIDPVITDHRPDLEEMLGRCDAALIIGDNALLQSTVISRPSPVEKLDLGQVWTEWTGLPFVWAFWTGPAGAPSHDDVRALQAARDAGEIQPDAIAREFFRDAPQYQAMGAEYLRTNIKYHLGDRELAGLERFFRCAADIGIAPDPGPLRFFE